MDYVFAFNGRMLAIMAVALVLLMGLSFGLGVVYAGARGDASSAELKVAAPAVNK